MSLISLAVIGKDNEPLYIRDFQTLLSSPPPPQDDIEESPNSNTTTEEEMVVDAVSSSNNDGHDTSTNASEEKKNEDDDPFGFFSSNSSPGESSSLRHQFLFHAALDRFDELLNISTVPVLGGGGGSANTSINTSLGSISKWRTVGSPSSVGISGSDSMWIGLLCNLEEMRIYGYLTNTSIKFMAIVQDTIATSQQIAARETELKLFFTSIHELYVEYVLNPFSNIKIKITSKRVDLGVKKCVNLCNKKYTSEGMIWI